MTDQDRAEQGIATEEAAPTGRAPDGRAPRGQAGAGQARPGQSMPEVGLQQAMMPVTGQPEIHPREKEYVRYELRNPNTVIPVIAAGAVAGILTIGRIIREIIE